MQKVRTVIRGSVFVLVALTLLGSLSCSNGAADNLLENAGIEDGEEPWLVLDGPGFERSTDQAHSGVASAHLRLTAAADDTGTSRAHLVQNVEAPDFPEAISGFYRVDNWTEGADIQFVQVAVIVFDAGNLQGRFPNHQVHYILAGTASEPSADTNIRNVQLGEELSLNRWVSFQADLRKDFTDLWGAEPTGFELIRVIFEVRYEEKQPGSTPVQADVYFDDLRLGPPLG